MTRKVTLEVTRLALLLKVSPRKEGINYEKTFFPFLKNDSLIVVLALVAHYDLEFHQMDVNLFFLNGKLKEEVYMDQHESFIGKEQALKHWYLKFNDTITSNIFREIIFDRSIYIKVCGSKFFGVGLIW